MRYLIGTESQVTAWNRQEALDRGVAPDAVTQFWYAVEVTASGDLCLMIDDDKNPVQGQVTSSVEPEWPAPEV